MRRALLLRVDARRTCTAACSLYERAGGGTGIQGCVQCMVYARRHLPGAPRRIPPPRATAPPSSRTSLRSVAPPPKRSHLPPPPPPPLPPPSLPTCVRYHFAAPCLSAALPAGYVARPSVGATTRLRAMPTLPPRLGMQASTAAASAAASEGAGQSAASLQRGGGGGRGRREKDDAADVRWKTRKMGEM